jgi:hypothetical protein
MIKKIKKRLKTNARQPAIPGQEQNMKSTQVVDRSRLLFRNFHPPIPLNDPVSR